MNWTYRLIGPEEEKLFDSFVAAHPKGHILQTYAWGEVKAATGWQPWRLVVEEEGKIVAAVSLLQRRLPYIRKSIFYAPRGPVVDFTHTSLCDFLLRAVKDLARQKGAILLKIDPDIPSENTQVRQWLQQKGFKLACAGTGFEGVQPRHVFRLDLRPSLEEIKQNFHPKTRYNIGLAQRKGVTVKAECTVEDLADFYRLLQETALRDRFLIRSYDYFLTLWKELVERGYAKLFLAYYQGRPIAGTLAFILGDKAWYMYGASSNRHRNVMPNYLLQWTMICWAKEQGCTLYDFRGVPGDLSEDHPLYGLYRFKKGFNGVFTEFIGEYDLVYSPLYYGIWRLAQPAYNLFRRFLFWRRKQETGSPAPEGGDAW
ncbi:MAG: lipid II:glycine glycyltransferase FemX [Moorellaceae bacterium]